MKATNINTGNILASKGWHGIGSGLTYGGPENQPVSIAFIGSSHLQQVTPLLLRLANQFQVRIALFSFGGDYGRFFHSSDSTSRASRAYGLNQITTTVKKF